jgi:glycosyltransferase involved in cell wall biosynthesis
MRRAASDGTGIRVLLVAHYFPPHVGGIENVVKGEAERLAAAGYEVVVLTTAVGAPAGVECTAGGYRVVRLATWNGVERRFGVPFPMVAPSALRTALRWVRSVHVVHCHDLLYMTTWIAALAAAIRRRPLVLTQHVHLVRHPSRAVELVQRAVYATVGRAVLRRAVRIAVLNGAVRAFLRGLGAPDERMELVPNGVDTDVFRPASGPEKRELRRSLRLPEEDVLALFVGRFVPKKGYDTVCASADDGYVLVLAGGPPSPRDAASPGVVFTGPVPHTEVADLFRACDVFVLPSVSEGFPVTVQEAMACGLPVVTTDDPAYDVYGLDRDDVALVAPTVPAVTSALRRLAADASLRRRMGSYSHEFARSRFSWPEHTRTLGRHYGLALGLPREVARVGDAD